ncbi:uncharacterized protein LOC131685693 [Topomyia yanbarensis]|uniref:uncharacterized protein LOC131685693 n=1 Tax=Topomyia yanbarensis TaxID=2498891 RepID=UPI00273CD6EB|nr:uncharacterized protein LOC131685693 [Topomyia yanbarensis]
MEELTAEQRNCRHRFRCLLCSDTEEFCDCSTNCHFEHPRQALVSDDLLVALFGSKSDDQEFVEINIFDCPYCDRRKLSISRLYDHLTLEHLDIPFSVRCPVCVCFGDCHSLLDNIHLSEHIVTKHSVTFDQYQENLLICDIYCADDRDLLKFIAATLPPTYCGAQGDRCSPPASTANPEADDGAKRIGRTCAICLDLVFETRGRELPCNHKFHSECINRWISQSATCPVCRKSIPR